MGLLAYVTFPEKDAAKDMALALVEAGLAAGVHVDGPVDAVYRWRGETRNRQEWRILAQISQDGYERLQKFVLARHSYEVPCIMVFDISAGYRPFLEWIEKSGN